MLTPSLHAAWDEKWCVYSTASPDLVDGRKIPLGGTRTRHGTRRRLTVPSLAFFKNPELATYQRSLVKVMRSCPVAEG